MQAESSKDRLKAESSKDRSFLICGIVSLKRKCRPYLSVVRVRFAELKRVCYPSCRLGFHMVHASSCSPNVSLENFLQDTITSTCQYL